MVSRRSGKIAVKLSDVRASINNLGTFVQAKLGQVGQKDVNELVKDVARLYTMSIAGFNTIRAERDENNGAADNNSMLPPALADHVAALSHAEFCTIVSTHTERLLSPFSRRDVDAFEQEHEAFVDAITHEEPLRNVLKDHDATIPFSDSWKCLGNRFKLLAFAVELLPFFLVQVKSRVTVLSLSSKRMNFGAASWIYRLKGVLHCK
jgi:hypothetical protein